MQNLLLPVMLLRLICPKRSNSGLLHAMSILKKIKSISIIHFDKNDIVRHRLVRDIVEAYEKHFEEKDQAKEKAKAQEKAK